MKKSPVFAVAAAVIALAAAAVWLVLRAPRQDGGQETAVSESARTGRIADAKSGASKVTGQSAAERREANDAGEVAKTEGAADGGEEELTEEEKREKEDEARVDAFDGMTDKFMDAEEDRKPVTMDDVKKFRELFKRLPKERKEECLHRALNLIPDENVMLLAGILMDKDEEKELVELVFNDILNRDESVKQVLLKEIIKDRSHPCWADTAWILDVTGKGDDATGKGEK